MICLVKLNHIQLGKENSRTCLKPPPSYHTTSMYVPGPSVLSSVDQVRWNHVTDLSSPSLLPQGGITIEFSLPIAHFQKIGFIVEVFSGKTRTTTSVSSENDQSLGIAKDHATNLHWPECVGCLFCQRRLPHFRKT